MKTLNSSLCILHFCMNVIAGTSANRVDLLDTSNIADSITMRIANKINELIN
ncbi:MAG: hypothetical protein HZC54_20190 [Verrucomicrobia bacterium]|nr:hypothetical protein [Verrucomicrobiota bacterium]